MMRIENIKWYILIIALLITDLAILLNIPFLRQILGFLFLTFLPGLLILQILKLNKIDSTEKVVLSVGLSISFLMFFGLLINNLSLDLGYERPLSTISLLILFNLAFITLAIIGYTVNKEPLLSLSNFNLRVSEKAFLIVPILFPALSIFGMHVMNTTDNNIILMFLLFLIPTYVAFVCFFNHKFPKRLYPIVIFSISISLLLLLSLRSNHIIGVDTHIEYYFFRTTLDNLHWRAFGHYTLDACLAISLLPTIYQSILNIPSEFLYKILPSLIYSVSPLVIYVISKKYIGDFYGFLASCFFMFQNIFLWTAFNARANIAMLFFAFAMMALFSDRIDPLKKRILFIVFMASCMVSHYSTAYIFFFVLVGTFIGMEILSKKYTFKKIISLTLVILFFSMIFFWYSQVTVVAFDAGVRFIDKMLIKLNEFFILESRGAGEALLGKEITEKSISHKIEFVFTWLTFALIGIGVVTLIRRYKEMSFAELGFKKPDFLKTKFEVEYFVITLACAGLLVTTVAVPFVGKGYGLGRLYPLAITILSVFFVIGGIMVAKYLNQIIAVLRGKVLTKLSFKKKGLPKTLFASKKPLRKNISKQTFKKHFASKSVTGGKGLEVPAYLIILLVLIPYFLCCSGVVYNLFGVPREITFNSEGKQYDQLYVHDQESYAARWLANNAEQKNIYTGYFGDKSLMSQGGISPHTIDRHLLLDERGIKIKGYIYLRYHNVVNDKLVGRRLGESPKEYNLEQYKDKFAGKDNVYNNGGAEVYR